MADSDKVFAGSIPKFYETLMVPLIFKAYAADLAELVAASSRLLQARQAFAISAGI